MSVGTDGASATSGRLADKWQRGARTVARHTLFSWRTAGCQGGGARMLSKQGAVSESGEYNLKY